jgi:hypothetical protein
VTGGRSQKKLGYYLQSVEIVLATCQGLSATQCVPQPGGHYVVKRARKTITNTLRLANPGKKSCSVCGIPEARGFGKTSKLFLCANSINSEIVEQSLIMYDPLRSDSLSYATVSPISFKKLHYRKLNWVDNQPERNT